MSQLPVESYYLDSLRQTRGDQGFPALGSELLKDRDAWKDASATSQPRTASVHDVELLNRPVGGSSTANSGECEAETGERTVDPDGRREKQLQEDGAVLFRLGLHKDAEGVFVNLLDLNRQKYGEKSKEVGQCLNYLSCTAFADRRLDDAASYLERQLEVDRSVFGDKHPKVALVYNNLAVVDVERGQVAQSLPKFATAVGILEGNGSKSAVAAQLASTRADYRQALSLIGRVDRVRETRDCA